MDPIKTKYIVHKAGAKRRNIEFLLTFDEWYKIWQDSGKWHLRGRNKGQYVMCRYNDSGPYSVTNVFIDLTENNVRSAQLGTHNPRGPFSDEHRKNLSIARTGIKISCVSKLKGRPQTEEHKMKNRLAQLQRNANKKLQEI